MQNSPELRKLEASVLRDAELRHQEIQKMSELMKNKEKKLYKPIENAPLIN